MDVLADAPYDEAAKKFWDQEAVQKAKANATMKVVLQDMKRDSFATIEVEWDGHDDSGSITSVVFVKSDGERLQQKLGGDQDVEAVEEFVFSIIGDGWWNNEGGFGTCIIDVQTGEYDIKHVVGWGPRTTDGDGC